MLELVTGERLYVECLTANRDLLEFRWRGGNRVRVPWTVVASLSNSFGVVDVLDESFEDASIGQPTAFAHSGRFSLRCDAAAQPWRWECPSPIVAGQLQWCQRGESGDGRIDVILEFGHPKERLVIESKPGFSESRASRSDASSEDLETRLSEKPGFVSIRPPEVWTTDFRQPVAIRPGWRTVSVDWGDGRWRVLIDDAVLATGRGVSGGVFAIQFGPPPESAVVWIDDVRLQRGTDPIHREPVAADAALDSMTLASGDVFFGKVLDADSAGWQLEGPRGTICIPWTEWAAVRLGARAMEPSPSRFVHGSLRIVHAHPPNWPRGLPEETLIAAANARYGDRTEWDHPLLGRLVLAASEIGEQQVQHSGDFCWLEPQRVHLGDELRSDFSHSRPHGHALSGRFKLHALPRGACHISLDVAELEPSEPSTPPNQPFLQHLRGGALRTELLINGRLVGDWNRMLSWRPPASRPERLRLEVPRELLRVGENRWEIRQQPLAVGDDRFDDCELGRIALEIGH